MVNKILIFIFSILLFIGCSSNIDNNKIDYPYKIMKIIKSKNKKVSVVVIKTGTESGATVGFEYQFFIIKNNNLITKNRFLRLKGLREYSIKWTSINTLMVTVTASRIIEFKSEIFNSKTSYIITKFFFVNH